MTSRQILIVGARIKPRFHRLQTTQNFEETIEPILRSHRPADSAYEGPKLLVVNRAYDSVELEDHPVYLVWDILKIPDGGPLKQSAAMKMIRVISAAYNRKPRMKAPSKLRDLFAAFHVDVSALEFGLYVDQFDTDRGYELYALEHEPYKLESEESETSEGELSEGSA